MKSIEYIYANLETRTINVIELKLSQNSKIGDGLVIQTYHFSIEQISNNDITLDSVNCLDCPLSRSNGYKLGMCYTHKGLQLMGLKSKLRKLHKMYNNYDICEFDQSTFDNWKKRVSMQLVKNIKFNSKLCSITQLDKMKDTFIKLCRFGAYGEPIFLGENVTSQLSTMAKNITGYTHQYNKNQYNWANKFFMASTHNQLDKSIAKNRNFRQFNVVLKNEKIENSVNCPSSKEFEEANNKKVSCVDCSLCSGNFKNLKKDIHILAH